jgi:hypothetical protein
MGAAITALRNTPGLRWVNPLEIKNAVESALTDRFGAKGEAKPKGKVSLRSPVLQDAVRVSLIDRYSVSTGTQTSKGCGDRSVACFHVCHAQPQIGVRGGIPWQVTQTWAEPTGYPGVA